MIHILFLLLLIIVCLLVFIICSILFVPIRYRIKAEKENPEDTITFACYANWLFRCIVARFCYVDRKWSWHVRIAWKTIDEKHPKKEEEKKASEKKVKKKCTIKKICDKLKKIWKFITDEIHITSLGKVIKEVFSFLKRLFPKHVKGQIHFGCEDPYNTGRILAGLSAFYPFYGDAIEIYPDFEQKILTGKLYAKGKVRNISILITLFKILFDKDIKKTYEDYKMLNKQEE